VVQCTFVPTFYLESPHQALTEKHAFSVHPIISPFDSESNTQK